MKTKKNVMMIICMLICFSIFVSSSKKVFAGEVKVEDLKFEPYIGGFDDKTFRPMEYVTRAELAKIVSILATNFDFKNEEEYIKVAEGYKDVIRKWYKPYVGFVVTNQIMNGFVDKTFKPNAYASRAEVCQIVATAFELKDLNVKRTFSDVKENFWYTRAIKKMVSCDLITGYNDGTFKPNNKMKRCELISLMNKVLDRKTYIKAENIPKTYKEEMSEKYKDVKETDWFYNDVLVSSIECNVKEIQK